MNAFPNLKWLIELNVLDHMKINQILSYHIEYDKSKHLQK